MRGGERFNIFCADCHGRDGYGLGIVVTSSELPELIALCDRILVLCEGRLTGSFTRGQFSEQALMEAATRRKEHE